MPGSCRQQQTIKFRNRRKITDESTQDGRYNAYLRDKQNEDVRK